MVSYSREWDMSAINYKFTFVLFNLSLIHAKYVESQNNRFVGFGRHLWRLSSLRVLFKAGSPTAGCSGPYPVGSWICPSMQIPQLFWAACSSLQSSSHYKKMFYLIFAWNFLNFHSGLFPLILSLDVTEKSLALSSLLPPPQLFIHTDETPLSHLFSRLNSPSSLSLSLNGRCSIPSLSLKPFPGLAPVSPCLFCTEELRTQPTTPAVAAPLPCCHCFA